jgi:hypothetical protein
MGTALTETAPAGRKRRRHRKRRLSKKLRQEAARREITQAHDRALEKAQVRIAADGTKITVFKPGKAQGADDMRDWAQRRNVGRAGVRDNTDRNLTEKQKRARMKRWREDWLRRAPRV